MAKSLCVEGLGEKRLAGYHSVRFPVDAISHSMVGRGVEQVWVNSVILAVRGLPVLVSLMENLASDCLSVPQTKGSVLKQLQ